MSHIDETDMTIPRLSVVTVCYNSRHLMARMLGPLSSMAGVECIVVDNGSVDGSVQFLENSFPSVKVIQTGENLGFSKAVNVGVRAAHAEVLLLLNPDARIETDAIETCLTHIRADPNRGIVAPDVQHPDGRLATLEAGHDPTLWRVFTHWSGVSRLARTLPLAEGHFLRRNQLAASRSVGWVSGSCMFVARSAWDAVGGLDERWFMYAEDTDFCLRVGDAGFDVEILVEARAEHAIGKSSTTSFTDKKDISHAWVLNTFDLYKKRHRPNLVATWCWRSVVSAGLMSRAVGYRRRAQGDLSRSGHGTTAWQAESEKFRSHARALRAEDLRLHSIRSRTDA